MTIWSKLVAYLSGWPESKQSKKEREQIYLFAEEEKKNKENKKIRKQGNIQ